MTETVIASVTLTKRLPDRRSFSVTAKLVHLQGNARPYFSVTAEERNLRRRGDNQVESAGQMTEETLRHFPELAPIVALHLADDRGEPMYAIDNGAYWLGLGDPRYVPDDAPRMDIFAKLWRVTDDEAREIFAYADSDNHPSEALRFMAKSMRERWQREADEGLALIRSLASRASS